MLFQILLLGNAAHIKPGSSLLEKVCIVIIHKKIYFVIKYVKYSLSVSLPTKIIGNLQYSKYDKSHEFLKVTARRDITSLHNCISSSMFNCLAKMVWEAWKNAGEVKLAETYFCLYVVAFQ